MWEASPEAKQGDCDLICVIHRRTRLCFNVLLFFALPSLAWGDCRQALLSWQATVRWEEVEGRLLRDPVVAVESMSDFLRRTGHRFTGHGSVFLISFASGLQAAVKPRQVSAASEAGAYRASQWLKSNLVPPTVQRRFRASDFEALQLSPDWIRELTAQVTSVQLFIESPYDLSALSVEAREELWSQVSEDQKIERTLFAFVFGQWDLHWGNLILDANFSLAMIDNENIRTRQAVRYGELPFLWSLRLQPSFESGASFGSFPFHENHLLVRPDGNQIRTFLGDRVSDQAWENFWKWHLNKPDLTMRIVFWQNAVWIQRIGFGNYGPLVIRRRPRPEVLAQYRSLTLADLRSFFPSLDFSDEHLLEMLDRRNQVLAAVAAIR
jgi:hypothetical protein